MKSKLVLFFLLFILHITPLYSVKKTDKKHECFGCHKLLGISTFYDHKKRGCPKNRKNAPIKQLQRKHPSYQCRMQNCSKEYTNPNSRCDHEQQCQHNPKRTLYLCANNCGYESYIKRFVTYHLRHTCKNNHKQTEDNHQTCNLYLEDHAAHELEKIIKEFEQNTIFNYYH